MHEQQIGTPKNSGKKTQDNTGKYIQPASQKNIQRFFFMLLGLISASPLTYTITYNSEISFGLLTAVLFGSIPVMLTVDFRETKNASFYRFLLRTAIALLIGFMLFSESSLLTRILITIYTLALTSVLSYSITHAFQNLSALCFIMVLYNLISGVLTRHIAETPYFGPYHLVITIFSTIAILAFFIFLNIDNSRQFGEDILRIPSAMNMTSGVVIILLSMLMAVITFMPWIIDFLETVLMSIVRFLYNLPGYLMVEIESIGEEIPLEQEEFPFLEETDPSGEPRPVPMIIVWILVGLSGLALFGAIVFAFIKLILFIFKLFKTKQQQTIFDNEVFTETIEKIVPTRKIRTVRNFFKRPRYSSLQTERERIIFIYNEYVRKAKRNNLTFDSTSDTPNEVLNEIAGNISEKPFPLPENLASAFNTVKYGNNIDPVAANLPTADSLKQRLL